MWSTQSHSAVHGPDLCLQKLRVAGRDSKLFPSAFIHFREDKTKHFPKAFTDLLWKQDNMEAEEFRNNKRQPCMPSWLLAVLSPLCFSIALHNCPILSSRPFFQTPGFAVAPQHQFCSFLPNPGCPSLLIQPLLPRRAPRPISACCSGAACSAWQCGCVCVCVHMCICPCVHMHVCVHLCVSMRAPAACSCFWWAVQQPALD